MVKHQTIYDVHGIGEGALDGLRAAARRITDARRRLFRQPPAPIPPTPTPDVPELPQVRDCGLAWYSSHDPIVASVVFQAPDKKGRMCSGFVDHYMLRLLTPGEIVQLTEAAEKVASDLEAEADERDRQIDQAVEDALAAHDPAIRALAERLSASRKADAEREEWIREHGSRRLQRLLAEGIEHMAVYRDERLALERPGWRYDAIPLPGTSDEPRNPPEAALDLLDEARATVPDADRTGVQLVFWTVEPEEEDDAEFDEYEEEPQLIRGYTCRAEFLGREIVYRVADNGTPPVVID